MFNRYFTRIFLLLSAIFLFSGCRSTYFSNYNTKVECPITHKNINYTVILSEPHKHYIKIKITIENLISSYLDFVLPAWSPGRYLILDFSKHVKEVNAYNIKEEKQLKVKRIDKETWRVFNKDEKDIILSYCIYANYCSGTFSQLSADGALLNGASIFMYLKGASHLPINLSIQLPPNRNWEIATGLPPKKYKKGFNKKDNTYRAKNYEHLIDCPLSIGKIKDFKSQIGDNFTYVVFNSQDIRSEEQILLEKKLADNCKVLIETVNTLFGELTVKEYYFIFHLGFAPGHSDGMEHHNSTIITDIRPLSSKNSLARFTTLAAHELFHVWNGKCIYPIEFSQYNLDKEIYTRSLWIVEGLTKYYQNILQLRAGLISKNVFREKIASYITNYENNPGRFVMNLEESSFLTWFDRVGYEDNNRANTRVSYYNKGAILGLLLDMKIRSHTKGRRGLDDVFRLMYKKYYKKNKGYTTEDFYSECENVIGIKMDNFFNQYAKGLSPFSYNEISAPCGFILEKESSSPVPDIGVEIKNNEITHIIPGSSAEQAGLQKYDVIIAIGDLAFTGNLAHDLALYNSGDKTTITIKRNRNEHVIPIVIEQKIPFLFIFKDKPIVDQETYQIRQAFYTGRQVY